MSCKRGTHSAGQVVGGLGEPVHLCRVKWDTSFCSLEGPWKGWEVLTRQKWVQGFGKGWERTVLKLRLNSPSLPPGKSSNLVTWRETFSSEGRTNVPNCGAAKRLPRPQTETP